MACGFCDDDEREALAVEVLDQTAVMELAAHIQASGSAAAAEALDLVFRDEPRILEWIACARNSNLARRLVPEARS